MATYNGQRYIKEQVQSILSQLGEEDELVVSDDHSTDGTLEVLRDIKDPRIRIVLNPGEKGYTRNFENALRESTGSVLFLADQDDVWVSNKVERMLEQLQKADMVVSDARIVDEHLDTIQPSHFALYGVKRGFWINFLKTRYIGACLAFRREVLGKALPFPKRQKLCAHDYWLINIGELYFRFALLEEPLILYRRHGNNALTGGAGSTNSLKNKLKVRLYTLYHLIFRRFY